MFKPVVKIQTENVSEDISTESINRICTDMEFSSSSSELSSLFHYEFPSPTEASEAPLSEAEVRKRTDPELLKPIPGPNLDSVALNWGEETKTKLENLLLEYDELFMKHKADIGRCKIG